MDMIYVLLLIITSIFLIYGCIYTILTFKFVKSLSTQLREKYHAMIKIIPYILGVALIFALSSLITHVLIFKCMALIVSIFLITYCLSELSILREYI